MAEKDMLEAQIQSLRSLYDKVWNILFMLMGAVGVVFMAAQASDDKKYLYWVVIALMLLIILVLIWLSKVWKDLSLKTKELRDV